MASLTEKSYSIVGARLDNHSGFLPSRPCTDVSDKHRKTEGWKLFVCPWGYLRASQSPLTDMCVPYAPDDIDFEKKAKCPGPRKNGRWNKGEDDCKRERSRCFGSVEADVAGRGVVGRRVNEPVKPTRRRSRISFTATAGTARGGASVENCLNGETLLGKK